MARRRYYGSILGQASQALKTESEYGKTDMTYITRSANGTMRKLLGGRAKWGNDA
jgi:hypothetical protein